MVFQGFCSRIWLRKRSKIAPRRPQDGLGEVLFRCSKSCLILIRFGFDFGCLWALPWAPKGDPKSIKFVSPTKGAPKRSPKRPQEAPRGPKRPQESSQEAPRGSNNLPKRPPRASGETSKPPILHASEPPTLQAFTLPASKLPNPRASEPPILQASKPPILHAFALPASKPLSLQPCKPLIGLGGCREAQTI